LKNLLYLNKYFIKYKWHLIGGILFVIAANYFAILIPQILRDSIDFIFDEIKEGKANNSKFSELNKQIMWFVALVMGVAILRGIFMYFMRQTIIVMSRHIEYDLRQEIFAKYESMDNAFYKTQRTGDLMSRIYEDVNKVRMYLGPVILYGVNLLSTFFLVIFSMLSVSPKLSLYTLLPLPILSVSIYFVSRMINQKSEIIQRQIARLTTITQESYSGIRVMKSYVKEKQFQDHFLQECIDYEEKNIDLAKVNAFFHPLMILLVGASTLLTIYIGGIMAMKGEITAGNLAEFIIYINYLTWPFTAIGWMVSVLQEAEASQGRINQFLHVNPEITNTNNEDYKIHGEIEFRNVTFRYPDTNILALDNVSFTLKKGEKLALLGKTASGKSTIADLIVRLYNVDSGQILIDGKDINEHNLSVLRQSIGYVPQDSFLFSDSIANNIRFGNEDAKMDEVEEYADAAALLKEIENFPDGMKTKVGERGVSLSGGQKQRVSIARALIKDPNIVLLDDCLSAVDANTENDILNALNSELDRKTTIVITHRFYNLLEFDKIIVLDNGRIGEIGRHEELIENGGFYAEQYESQMSAMSSNPQ